ncbi:aminotransferase class IV [Alicyclobacillus ferrooxydans]|uniref:aminotransferase class IV n=1 Tax=Alicyclobacillus ferrooxydans TaxID=471514 RepID=UPI0006D57669|nr:aminotransferase class IV [Alicyclobacillus ferrooxydans]
MPFVGYYNGEFIESNTTPVPIEERGHQFGDGVYEVVRVYGGRPFLLDWHLERMENSLRAIQIANPFDRHAWVELINEAVRRSGEPESTVYWQVTRGIAPRNHVFPSANSVVSLTVRPQPPAKPANDIEAGPADHPLPPLVAWPDERWSNAFVKSINLLPNVIAKEVAHRLHAQEAMLVREGTITECSGSNVWFVKHGELYTHPTNRYILPGITRRFVLDLARESGVPVHEQALQLSDLKDVDEVFVTSTTQEIQMIGEIVVPVSQEQALHHLPSDIPSSLVESKEEFKTLWKMSAAPTVGSKLKQKFSETVHRIQDGEVTLAVRN